jgi:CubicO group peptidase (beta-lactamase class C family)
MDTATRGQPNRSGLRLPGIVLRKPFYALIALLIFTAATRAQSDHGAIVSQLNPIVERAFKATRCPGLSVAVSTHDQVIYSKALGLGDSEENVPLRTVTGTIIMDLVQSDRLMLDASVTAYVADLPAIYGRVTVRQLLSHQAGVRDYRDMEEVFSALHYRTSRDALRAFMDDPLLFEPGTKTAYSTFGFTMVGAVAEAATHESFQELSKAFFRHYGIRGFDLDDPQAIVNKRVRGYSVDKDGKIANTRAYDASNKYPGGGFTASAEDYLRFVIAVGSGRVLKPEVLQQTWTPQKTSDGTLSRFGLGWGVLQFEGRRMVGFNGLQPSTTASIHYFPGEGVGVVLLCNAEVTSAEGVLDLSKLMEDLQKLLLPLPN